VLEGPLLLLVILFLLGMFQGFTFCNLTCGPLFVLRLAEGGRGAARGVLMALLFSLPRTLLLTALGALAGLMGGSLAALGEVKGSVVIRTVVYLLLGAVMLLSGASFIKGPKQCKEGCGPSGRRSLIERTIARLGHRSYRGESLFMLGAGMLVSVVCVSEATAAVLAASSYMGVETESVGMGALMGAASMLVYSLGLAVPLIVLGAISSEMGRRMQRDDVRKVGGLLLCLFGGGLMVLTLVSLLL